MAIDTKPNFSNRKFEQCATDTMNLSGCTQIFGLFDIETGATLTICENAGDGKLLTSSASGIATWETLNIPTQGVTSISGGSGMNFTTITTTGEIVLGTPSTILNTSTDISSGTTHNHSFSADTFVTGSQGILVDGNNRFYLDDPYISNSILPSLHTIDNVTSNQSLGNLPTGQTLGMVYIRNTGTTQSTINLGTTTTGNDITPYQPVTIDAGEDVSITVNMRLSIIGDTPIYINSDDWTNVALNIEWANITFKNVPLPTGGTGGSPAGNDTYIQFNDSGSFGANIKLSYDDSNNAFTAGWRTGTVGVNSVVLGGNEFHGELTGRNGALGDASFAHGIETYACGEGSTVWGEGSSACGDYSTAWGGDSTARGGCSTAWGSATYACENFSTAWGRSSHAKGLTSTAWGCFACACGTNSIAGGTYLGAHDYGEHAIGMYNIVGTGSTTTINVNDNLFTIGNGVSLGTRSNALQIKKSGNLYLPHITGCTASNVLYYDSGDGSVSYGTAPSGGTGGSPAGNDTYIQFNDSGSFGANIKLSYDDSNNAFTAGWRCGTVGCNSVVLGGSQYAGEIDTGHNIASGIASYARGIKTVASGCLSTTNGCYTCAIGDLSTAGGGRSCAKGCVSIAMGDDVMACGDITRAFGKNTFAIECLSTVWGYYNCSNGIKSTTWGDCNRSNGNLSTTWGHHSLASGCLSTAWGYYNCSVGDLSTTSGTYSVAHDFIETVIGAYDVIGTGSTTTWNVNDNLFTVGNGISGARSNALQIKKSGNLYLPHITGCTASNVLYYDSGDGSVSYGTAPSGGTGGDAVMQFAVSDETTDLTTGTAKITFRMPYAMTLSEVRASVGTAPTGANLVVDINENGTSILSTKLSIDVGEKTSKTAATLPVISDANLADDSEITVDIDNVGSTVAGAGLKITFK